MDENKLRFGVGVLVISAIGIGIILTFLFGAFPSVLKRDYTLSVVFPSAEGIGANTPVLRDGVRIGRVADIQLREEGGVLVTLAMDESKPVTHRYVPQIGSGNFVTGDAKLEFVRAEPTRLTSIFGEDQEILQKPYSDGEFLEYGDKAESITELQNELKSTLDAIRTAGQSIAGAGESVNQLSTEVRDKLDGTDQKVDRVAEETVQAMQEFEAAMREIREIVGDQDLRDNLEQSINELPELLSEARSTLNSTKQTFQSFERMGNQFERVGVVAEEAVGNLKEITDPLADQSDQLLEQVVRTLTRLEGTLVEVEVFGRSLNRPDGAFQRLLQDDELYWQVKRTVENLEDASARVRPILNDVRIFTDKIARDPRQLGVRGALSKRPSGAGLK